MNSNGGWLGSTHVHCKIFVSEAAFATSPNWLSLFQSSKVIKHKSTSEGNKTPRLLVYMVLKEHFGSAVTVSF